MARKFLTAIDLAKNEIQNAVAQVLAADPSSPVPGQFYYNSTVGRVLFRNASSFLDYTSRANHTGTQTASTISNFDTQVRTSSLDQMAVPTAAVSFNSQRLTNLATPTADTDAATKGYVDSAVNGTDWKNSVRVATTTNITLSGLQTIDGVTLSVNDRVLVKDQTTATQNGLYAVQSGAWTRTTDADGANELTSRATVAVEEGTANAGRKYTITNTGTITIGSTAITWALTDTGGVTYTSGTGISIDGSVISLNTTVAVRKFAQTIGTGAATSIAVTHGLNTLDVQVQVYEVATGETVECDVTRNSTSQVTLGFAVAPISNSLRVLVQG
jgi:phage-related tail fiber protein